MPRVDEIVLANKDYVAEQYRRYHEDPSSVSEKWALFFAGFDLAAGNGALTAAVEGAAAPGTAEVADLVHTYRELGHLVAHLNPLEPPPSGHPLLELSEFGFGPDDLDRVVQCASFCGSAAMPLRELIARLQETYCHTLGVEYLHIQDKTQREWLQEHMEPTGNRPDLAPEDRLNVLQALVIAEGFERFLGLRYPTAKRFSLEGSDTLIVLLDTLVESAGDLGVRRWCSAWRTAAG